MAVYVKNPRAEKKLRQTAKKLPGKPNKTGLINEIVDRASQLSPEELLQFLRPNHEAGELAGVAAEPVKTT